MNDIGYWDFDQIRCDLCQADMLLKIKQMKANHACSIFLRHCPVGLLHQDSLCCVTCSGLYHTGQLQLPAGNKCAIHTAKTSAHITGSKHLVGVHIPCHGCCLGASKHRGHEGRLPVRLVVVFVLLRLVPPYLEGACQGLPSLRAGQHAMLILDGRAMLQGSGIATYC